MTSQKLFSNKTILIGALLCQPLVGNCVVPAGPSHSSGGIEFSYSLFRTLAKASRSNNFVLSPFAVRTALGIAAAGAKGRTQRQLGKVPEMWTQKKDPPYKLLMANRLWVDMKYPLLESFIAQSDKAQVERPWMVDFSKAPDFVCSRINEWAEAKTAGKIKQVISENAISAESKMTLVSAAYFKGDWVASFESTQTYPQNFTTQSGDEVKIPFVHKKGNYMVYKGPDVQVLDLPYVDGEIALTLIYPNSPKTLESIESDLNPGMIEKWASALTLKEVAVAIPKFEISHSLDLTQTLMELGITDPFNKDTADFSVMTGQKNLFLDHVTYKSALSFTEEGTEGTAGIAEAGRGLASVSSGETVTLERPFLFLVRHRATHSPLFIGHMVVAPAQ